MDLNLNCTMSSNILFCTYNFMALVIKVKAIFKFYLQFLGLFISLESWNDYEWKRGYTDLFN